MCRWRSWILPGLIAVALLTAMAMVFKSSSIEADLTKRATAGLAADGQGWASVALDGRDATLQGTAPSPEAKVLAVQSADRVFGVRIVDDGAGLLPEEKPYRWSATRAADGAVTVGGFVPDDATRKSVLDTVGKALPGVTVKDEQKLARGAPAGLVGAAGFAAEQLGKLAEGTVAYQDQALSAVGRAATLDSHAGVTKTLGGGLPAGYSLAKAEIAAPNVSPYVWAAALAPAGITLSGLVPSEAARAEIVAAAKAVAPNGAVTDTMKLAGGAPAGFAASTAYGLSQLGRFTTGAVDMKDAALTVTGQAKTPSDYTAALAALGALPAGATLAAGTVQPAVVPNWTFGIAKTRDVATVSGFVPSTAARDAVTKAIASKIPGVKVVDQTQLAAGLPASFGAAADFGVGQLARLETGAFGLSPSGVTLEGLAADPATRDTIAGGLAAALPAGVALQSQKITAKAPSPYVFGINRTGDAVELTGFLPSEARRAELVAAVKAAAPAARVDDKTRIAEGPPAGFDAATALGLAQLPRLGDATIAVSDAALSVTGAARTPADYQAATVALAAAPAGTTVPVKAITPAVVPNWTFGIAKTRDVATISGFVPSDAARDAVVAAIGSKLPGVKVVDQTQLAAGLPASFGATADFGVGQLARLETGAFGLSSGGVTLEGLAADPATRDTIAGGLAAALPAGVALQSQKITAKAPSPYVFDVKRIGSAVELTGFVPSEARRADLVAAVRAASPGARIDDKTRLADGQPAGFDAAAALGIDQLKRLGDATVSVSDATLGVTGAAKSPADYQAVMAALAAAPAGATVGVKAITPAAIADWTFGVARGADQVTLTGYVPSDAARAEINQLAAAEFPGLKIDDKLQVAGGLPAGFGEAARYGLGQLGRLDTGRLGLSKGGLTLEGEAGDPAVQDAVEASLKAGVPGGIGAASAKLTSKPPSPYVFAAAKIGNAMSLNGYVPDQATKTEIVDAIKTRFGGVEVRDNLRVAAGAPAGFQTAANAGVIGASRLENGTALITDQSLSVTGGAFYGKAAEAIKTEVTSLVPRGWATDYSGLAVLPPPPQVDRPTCQIRIDEVLGGNSIRFTTGRAEISPVSAGLLDRLVYAASRCTANRIEISGHTDSDGTDENNQRLSEARAQAVSAYLTDAGIAGARLTAVGFGEAQPIAANDTPENKAKNRRIEFKVLEQN